MTIEGRPTLTDETYKKYSLEHLECWIHDALDLEDVTPKEIYNVIVGVIKEDIEYHTKHLDRRVKLLDLMEGKNPSITDASAHDFDDFWFGSQYTEEEINAMCDTAAEEEKEKCREYNLREAEYYTKRAELDAEHQRKEQCSCDY